MRGTPECVPLDRRRREGEAAGTGAAGLPTPSAPALAAPWRDLFAATAEEVFQGEMADDCLGDIAMLRLQRRPGPQEAYDGPEEVEARLLQQIDGWLACGPGAIEALQARAGEGIPGDPDLLFAACLCLGCIDDEKTLEAAARLLLAADPAEEAEIDGAAEAFCLMPHPRTARVIAPLLADPEPARRAAALRILSYRRELDPKVAAPLLGDSASAVARAAAESYERLPASRMAPGLVRLLDHADEAVVAAALRVLIRHRFPSGRDRARNLVEEGRSGYARAAWLLALSGHASDQPLFRSALAGPGRAEAAEAAGYHGSVGLVEDLIRLVGSRDETVRRSAAGALERMTGAGLTEPTVVPDPDAADQEFTGREPRPQQVRVIATDPGLWTEWWVRNRDRFDPARRYRTGVPFSPALILEEIEHGIAGGADRARACFELCVMAGDDAPVLEPLDFIERQREAIGAWRRWAEKTPGDGRWMDSRN